MPKTKRFPSLATILILLGSAAVAGCAQPAEQSENDTAEAPSTNLPSIPRPQPPLDRAALLSAVAEAASATAAGSEMPESVTSLDGRQFEVRIRFGCRGPAQDLQNAWLGWSYDAEKRTLRVQAKPTISKEEKLVADLAGEDYESVEGFWIPRPWLRQAVCPAGAALTRQPATTAEKAPTDPAAQAGAAKAQAGRTEMAKARENEDPATQSERELEQAEVKTGEPLPTAPRVGLAQFFTSDGPRTHRRDSRPYASVKPIPEGQPISSQGFNLVLSGRLRALPNKGVVQCAARTSQSPPECVVSVEFLRVRIEEPETKEAMAEWSTG